ncbi:MAG: glycosyl transferase family 2 [Rhodospirillaceae bacterium]|nr:glycosyl transferase family 2 [Rhodospirillaceae bacterium]
MNEDASHKAPAYSIVMPCYNEEEGLGMTVEHLYERLPDHGSFEIIIVNDGSSDRSGEILDDLTKKYPKLRAEHHQRNRGYGAALKTGIRAAHSDIIVITDADGTYPNERIPDLVAAMDEADMVVGSRTGANVTYSKIRAIPKIFLRRYASWISGRDIPDINSGLRAFRKSVTEQFLGVLPDSFSFTTTITVAFLTNYFRVRYVPIDYAVRKGKSKIKPIRDTLRFVQLIARTGMYFAPLRVLFPFFAFAGLLFLASAIYDVFVVANITDKTVILFFLCVNIMIFGLLADMIDKRIGK